MTDMNDYDDVEDSTVDEDEAKAAEKGAADIRRRCCRW